MRAWQCRPINDERRVELDDDPKTVTVRYAGFVDNERFKYHGARTSRNPDKQRHKLVRHPPYPITCNRRAAGQRAIGRPRRAPLRAQSRSAHSNSRTPPGECSLRYCLTASAKWIIDDRRGERAAMRYSRQTRQ